MKLLLNSKMLNNLNTSLGIFKNTFIPKSIKFVQVISGSGAKK